MTAGAPDQADGLQRLLDKAAIGDVINAYCLHLDRCLHFDRAEAEAENGGGKLGHGSGGLTSLRAAQ